MTSIRKILASTAIAGLVAGPLAMVPAMAQEQEMQAAPPTQQMQIDETKLRSFAVAYLEVNKVAMQYQPQLEATEDPEEQQRLQSEASNGMVQAVESAEGISVEEYSTILSSAQADPALAQQLNDYVRAAAEAEGQQ